MKNHGAFETCMELIEHALTSPRTKSKKLNELKGELKTFFYRYDESYRLYKADVIAKDSSTLAAFNGKDADDVTDSYPFNDKWSKNQMRKFIELTESIEEKIEELEAGEVKAPEAKHVEIEQENPDHLATEIKSEEKSLKQSIESFTGEVNAEDVISMTTAAAMEKFSEKLKTRLD